MGGGKTSLEEKGIKDSRLKFYELTRKALVCFCVLNYFTFPQKYIEEGMVK